MQDKKQRVMRKQYISRFYKGNRLAYFVMLLSAVLFSAINLAVTWLIQQLIDTVSGVPESLELGLLTLLTVGLILSIIPLKALNYVSQPRFMRKAMTQFKGLAFERLTRKNIASFRSEATSVYLSAFSNDLASIEANYLEKQYVLVFNTVWACGAMLLMVAKSPALAAVAIGLCFLPLIASSVTGAQLSKAEKTVSEQTPDLWLPSMTYSAAFPS